MPVQLIPMDRRINPIKMLPLFEIFSVSLIEIGIIIAKIIDTNIAPKPIKAGENSSSDK